MLKSAYRAFSRQCYLMIELMRQFYDEQRIFRIVGPSGENQFLPFSAAALRPQPVREVGGVELGSREPIFDIVVSAAKKSTFSRLSQNETAKECYQLGFFDPANADAALAAQRHTGPEAGAAAAGGPAADRHRWCGAARQSAGGRCGPRHERETVRR